MLVDRGLAADDLGGLLCKIRDHVLGDGKLNKVVESSLVLGDKGR